MGSFRHRKADIAAAYDRYADMLYRVALSQMQSAADAEDVVQDVFAKYISAAPAFQNETHEQAWFLRVTINRCHDLHRRHAIRNHLSLDEVSEIAAPEFRQEDENVQHVMNCLKQLPEKVRTVIILHCLEGFSVTETAALLKLSESAVKMRLSRGREALRVQIGKEARDV